MTPTPVDVERADKMVKENWPYEVNMVATHRIEPLINAIAAATAQDRETAAIVADVFAAGCASAMTDREMAETIAQAIRELGGKP